MDHPELSLVPQWAKKQGESPRQSTTSPPNPSQQAGGGGRFQNLKSAAPQGSFEAGRFTMPGDDRSSNSRPNTSTYASKSSQPSKPPAVSALLPLSSMPPKKIIQYSKEELLNFARPTPIDAKEMILEDLPEGIISNDWLEPVAKQPFDPEEIYNAWYDALTSEGRARGTRHTAPPGGGAGGGGPSAIPSLAAEGPPRVGDNWRSRPPTLASMNAAAPTSWGREDNTKKSFLPPSGGMGLDKMAAAAEQFAREMAASIARGEMPGGASEQAPKQLQGLLGESTGTSIFDEPLEEGLDRPPEEDLVPQEEAIDYSGEDAPSSGSDSNGAFKESGVKSQPTMLKPLGGGGMPNPLPSANAGTTVTLSELWSSAAASNKPPPQQQQQPIQALPSTGMVGGQPMNGGGQPWMEKERMQQQQHYQSSMGSGSSRVVGGLVVQQQQQQLQQPQGSNYSLDLLSGGGVYPSTSGNTMPSLLGVGGSGGVGLGKMPQQQASLLGQQQRQVQGSMFSPQQPAAPLDEWYYTDPQNAVQGPFSSKEMKEWLEAGFFQPDLPICFGHNSGPFTRMGLVFPDIRAAFSQPVSRLLGANQAIPFGGLSFSAQQGASQQGGGGVSTKLGFNQIGQQQQAFLQVQQQTQASQTQWLQQQQQQQQQQRQQQNELLQQKALVEEQHRREQQLRQAEQERRAAVLHAERLRVEDETRKRVMAEEKLQRDMAAAEQHQRLLREQQEQQHRAMIAAQAQAQAQAYAQAQAAAAVLPASPVPQPKPLPAWNTTLVAPTKTLAQIQNEEERERKQRQAAAPLLSPAQATSSMTPSKSTPFGLAVEKPTGTPWGKSVAPDSSRAPTLKEIQEAEEAERKHRTTTDIPPISSMASHLAKAAGVSTTGGWAVPPAGLEVKAAPVVARAPGSVPASVLAPPKAGTVSKPAMAAQPAAPAAAKPAVFPASPAPAKKEAVPSSPLSPSASTPSASGPLMGREFRQWCEVNASELGADMALLEYCYSVDSTQEIKDTFSGYLGFKPKVTNFSEEFIRRANLDKASKPSMAPQASSGVASATGDTNEWKSKGKKKR